MVLRFKSPELLEEKVIKGFAYLPKVFRVRGETIVVWWKHYEVTKRWVGVGIYAKWVDVNLIIKGDEYK